MKVSGKGVIAILVLLVAIPVLVDLVLSLMIPEDDLPHFSMTVFLLTRYRVWLPVYLGYLAIAFTILYFIKKHK